MTKITPKQCRAARSLLNLTQPELAKKSGVHIQTISHFEKNNGSPSQTTIEKLTNALELSGVEFIKNGVKEIDTLTKLKNSDGFQTLLDDVFHTAHKYGTIKNPCKIYVSNAAHRNWIKWMGEEGWSAHVKRMFQIKDKMDIRIIVKENDTFFPASSYSNYRWFPEKLFNDRAFYSYHDKLAFLNFQQDSVDITIMRQAEFAEGYRKLFEIAWDTVAINPI